MVGPCGPRDGGLSQSLREGGGNRNVSSTQGKGGGSMDARPEWMRLSPASRSGFRTPRGRQRQEDASAGGAHVERHDRQLWVECRQALHQAGMDTITGGVQGFHVDEADDAAVQEPLNSDDVDVQLDGDEDCDSDDLPEIRPLGRKVRSGSASVKWESTPRNRRNIKIDNDTGGSDGEGAQNFWSVIDTIALVRDQDLYFAGVGHNFGRMRTREWKWEDVRSRLQKMGVTRKAIDCGKKWDNLIQFKKVHKFQHLSGGKDYFKLASSAKRSEGFNFVMDRSMYEEMEAMTKGGSHDPPKEFGEHGGVGGGVRCR
ncbi:hypothetical protein CBR_g36571 [Chara braunii]|uniref:Myb-like domain-containing protein n=1 Tax=Chara braunii TaxID=69332 RepID=A0A388JZ83_CHABU|nr:hypothetical protein CBR_g36571 [Chara braunii]|eukprot:GBG63086.1 hypothetical protein CBR_g36571 [Chara braunii]